jgi:transposase
MIEVPPIWWTPL